MAFTPPIESEIREALRSQDLRPIGADAPVSGALRPAAVLCPIMMTPQGLEVILTLRAAHLKAHAGQVSFPGGKIDAGDPSPLAAALREAEEEIGLHHGMVDVAGSLDPYRTGTGFIVRPFVGFVDPRFRPVNDPGEVAEVFRVPLAFLLDPKNILRKSATWGGHKRFYYAIPFNHYNIWGATAGMLKSLSDRLLAVRGVAETVV